MDKEVFCAQKLKRNNTLDYLIRGIKYVIAMAFTVTAIGPLVWIFLSSLKTAGEIYREPFSLPSSLYLQNYIQIIKEQNIFLFFINSSIVMIISLAIVVLVASLAAYAFARLVFLGREILFMLILAALMVPATTLMVPLFWLLVKYHLINTRFGLALVYSSFSLPLAIFLLRGFFVQIPSELSDAARIDGCSEQSIFWRIMVPIAKPAIALVAIFHFVFYWNEFAFALVFLHSKALRTLPTALAIFGGAGRGPAALGKIAAFVILSVIPPIIFYAFFSNQIIKSMTAGALKG